MPKFENPDCINCELRSKSIFCDLNAEDVQALNSAKRCIEFKKGEFIFEEGSAPKGLYCVYQGKIKVTQMGIDGKDQILYLAKNSDVMGYRAILSGDKYSCSAAAIENSVLCFIPKTIFFSMVENNSKLALQIIHLFSNELKKAESNITQITQRPVKERLAQSLMLLKEKYGFEKDGCTINITVTRQEIANIAGTTRETATRLLYALNDTQIIELKGKKIKILNHKKLIETANVFD